MMENIFKNGIKKDISKKAISTILAGSLIFSSGGTLVEVNAFSLDKPTTTYEDFLDYNGIKIFINGRLVEFNDSMGYPYISNGRIMIPLRAVSNTFNAHVGWNKYSSTVYIDKQSMEVLVRVGTNKIVFSPNGNADALGKTIETDTVSEVKNGRTYVPLRSVFECFGLKVKWDASTKTAHIESEDIFPFIDFKDKEVVGISDIDFNKYSKIIYDGEDIDKSYVDILKNSDQYKVVIDKNTVYICSYQYLMDVNYVFCKVNEYYNSINTRDNIVLNAINENEFQFFEDTLGALVYNPQRQINYNKMNYAGTSYSIRSNIEDYQHDYVLSEVKKIADEARKSKDVKEQIRIVNRIMVNRIKYSKDKAYLYPYETLKNNVAGCGGFQSLFKAIMDELGIPCVKVNGMNASVQHGWNQVLIDGEWYLVSVSSNAVAENKETWLFVPLDTKQGKQFTTEENYSENINVIKLMYKFNCNN